MKSIFVSSTFKDMHAERDALMLKAIPELNEFAKDFGQSVRFVDLRWGINNENVSEDEANKKVLSVCLREIDATRPYIIILIGQRYGWIPPEDLMEFAVKEKGYATDCLDKSVTELEIEYGALSEKSMLERCLFYFREPLDLSPENEQRATFIDDEPHLKNKLDLLKKKILESGAKVSSYHCGWNESGLILPSNFTDKIVEDVKELFYGEFEKSKNLTWQEKERLAAQIYAEQKSEQFSARHNILNKFIFDIEDKERRVFIIKGEVGSGKSTIMSKISRVLAEKAEVVFVACGNSLHSGKIEDVQRQIIYRLEELLNEADSVTNSDGELSADKLTAFTENLMQRYAQITQKPLYIILDALDQLYFDTMLENFGFLPKFVPENITFIISCTEDFNLPLVSPLAGETKISTLKRLTPIEKPEVIKGILADIRKELSPEIIDAIVTAESSNNPLYLSLMLQRLIMLNSSDFEKITSFPPGITGIHQYMLYLVKNTPESTSAMGAELFREAARRINFTLCDRASAFIAVSRRGLRESDLEELLKKINIEWNSLDFSLFTKYLGPYFIRRDDGRIDFTHKSIREGILSQNIYYANWFIVPSSEKERKTPDYKKIINEYNLFILEHLKTLSDIDRVKVDELIYHAHKADDKHTAFKYIVDMCDDIHKDIDESELAIEFMKQSKNEMDILSRELCTIGKKDIKWVEGVLAFGEITITGMNYIEFITQNLMKLYTEKHGEYEYIKNIGLCAVKTADRLVENRKDIFSYYAQSRALWKYGEICEKLGEDKTALDYYEKDLTVNVLLQSMSEKLIESRKFFDFIILASLMECYDKLAAFYLEKEEENIDYDKVIEYSVACRNAAQKQENNNYIDLIIAVSYDREAQAHIGKGSLGEAWTCAYNANDIFVRVTQTPQNARVMYSVIANYRLLGDICSKFDKLVDRKEGEERAFTETAVSAAEFYRLAMANAELMMNNNGDASDFFNYCLMVNKYSEACFHINDIENAFEYAGKAMAVSQQLFKSAQTQDVAKVFKKALINKLSVYEYVEERGGQITDYKEFTDIYKELASLNLKLDDSEQACKYLFALYDLCQELEEKYGDEKHTLLLLEAYKELVYYFVIKDDLENAEAIFEEMTGYNDCLSEEFDCILFDVNVMLAAKKLKLLYKDGNEGAIDTCKIIVSVYDKINKSEPSDDNLLNVIRWKAILGREIIVSLSAELNGVDYYLEAIKLFEESKTLSENMEFLETMSVIYENTAKIIYAHDLPKAMEYLKKSAELLHLWARDQKTAEALQSAANNYHALADTYYNNGDFENAIDAYDITAKIHLEIVEITRNLAEYDTVLDILRYSSLVAELAKLYDKAISIMSSRSYIAYQLGNKLQTPKYFHVYENSQGKLSELYEKIGDIEKAKEHKHFQASAKQIIEFITPKGD